MKRITTYVFLVCCTLAAAITVAAQESKNGKKLYLTYCSGCHGSSGRGDGPAAKMLPVKPADHTQKSVMTQLTDQDLFQVISGGGKKVGKSPQMPAWGAVLNDEQIKDIVAYIRTLAGSPETKAKGK